MNQDPSVLDFIKARMRYWRSKLLHPSENMDETNESRLWIEGAGRSAPFEASANQALTLKRLPWWGLLAVGMGLLGQISLEPHPGSERTWQLGVILYLLACLFLIRSNGQNEFTLQAWEEHGQDASQDTRFLQSSIAFIVSLAFSLFAFVAFGGSRFTGFNLFLWSIGILTMIQAFWLRGTGDLNWVKNAKDVLFGSKSSILLNRSTLLFLAVLCVASHMPRPKRLRQLVSWYGMARRCACTASIAWVEVSFGLSDGLLFPQAVSRTARRQSVPRRMASLLCAGVLVTLSLAFMEWQARG
jgi:hypothetical protein